MRIAVTGREGQVALALNERCHAAGVELLCLARPQVDLLQPDGLAQAMATARPDIVINAAAYTAVDKAEAEPELAMQINGEGAGAVAAAAAKLNCPVIQISTDYVFNGALTRPYREDDPTRPVSVYGASKLAGERAALESNPHCVVARTAWVYSPFGNNFVKTMLRLGQSRETINVVSDQLGAPTSALDIADALIAMAQRIHAEPDEALFGVFHLTGPHSTTWAGFADAIFIEAAALGRKPVTVKPIPTKDYPTPAARPANSRLDAAKLREIYSITLPDWRLSVRQCVARLLAHEQLKRQAI